MKYHSLRMFEAQKLWLSALPLTLGQLNKAIGAVSMIFSFGAVEIMGSCAELLETIATFPRYEASNAATTSAVARGDDLIEVLRNPSPSSLLDSSCLSIASYHFDGLKTLWLKT